VTNQRDQSFKATIESKPEMKIVAEQGLADPARAEDIGNAFVAQNPDLDAIYVTWAEPAELVLAALRNAGNKHTKIVTLDLSEPLALDMVKDGNVAAIVADEAYGIGVTAARAAALGLIGEKVAPFLAVNAIAITKDTVKEGWNASLHRDPPASLGAN
jgi:ribose transport system substrate-binding protein